MLTEHLAGLQLCVQHSMVSVFRLMPLGKFVRYLYFEVRVSID